MSDIITYKFFSHFQKTKFSITRGLFGKIINFMGFYGFAIFLFSASVSASDASMDFTVEVTLVDTSKISATDTAQEIMAKKLIHRLKHRVDLPSYDNCNSFRYGLYNFTLRTDLKTKKFEVSFNKLQVTASGLSEDEAYDFIIAEVDRQDDVFQKLYQD